ncbi:MAG: hypothetical protein HC785_29370 [Calothrix sp. CSU_2_0]|nr:hypothetical protein [Calothrix sp. CSU_2_0]
MARYYKVFSHDKVNSINLSHDGKTLVSASIDGSIKIWDLMVIYILLIIKPTTNKLPIS